MQYQYLLLNVLLLKMCKSTGSIFDKPASRSCGENRYHHTIFFFYISILDTCLGYHKQLQIKKFDVISRIWGAILLLLKWVKRTKHSCRQPQAKKCQGSKSSSAAPKMPPGCSNPFFYFLGLKCAEMRVYCSKVNGLNKFVDKSDFFFLNDVSV